METAEALRNLIGSSDVRMQIERIVAGVIREYCVVFETSNPQLNNHQRQAYRATFLMEQAALLQTSLRQLAQLVREELSDGEIALLADATNAQHAERTRLRAKLTDAVLKATAGALQSDGARMHQASMAIALRTI